MDSPAVFFFTSVAVLAAITAAFFFTGKRASEKRLSGLATVSFILVLAGIVFGDNKTVGYVLLLIGLAFAVADIIRKRKKSDAQKEQ
ncbi:MAG: hypothetical protein PHF07_02075 [Candidatus Pacebacteria bacterium]|jgi:hypothetical protein|nr:hypothetical protein [Candidatus Paceibacterota bacterium]